MPIRPWSPRILPLSDIRAKPYLINTVNYYMHTDAANKHENSRSWQNMGVLDNGMFVFWEDDFDKRCQDRDAVLEYILQCAPTHIWHNAFLPLRYDDATYAFDADHSYGELYVLPEVAAIALVYETLGYVVRLAWLHVDGELQGDPNHVHLLLHNGIRRCVSPWRRYVP